MLIEFRVENHRSIRDEQALTMASGKVRLKNDLRPRVVGGCSKKLLPVAAIYGANASGKSNVLEAMAFMKEAVIFSHRAWSPNEGIPQEPFAWGQKASEPTFVEVEIVIDSIRYIYGFKFDGSIFIEEWLFAWPNKKKQVWFERDGDKFKFGEALKGENRLIEGVTRPNALFLSAAAQLKHLQLTQVFSWFAQIEIFNFTARRGYVRQWVSDTLIANLLEESSNPGLFDDEDSIESMAFRFRSLLRNADIGIVDVRAVRTQDPKARQVRFEFKHASDSDDAWLPLEEESRGTQTLFRLAVPVLRSMNRGSLLLVDELESSMHPNLAEHIVRQYNNPQHNSRNAQLIFTTHDTNLLGPLVGDPALRRDQVWLTEKDQCGATVLYPLTDFKPRQDENVERGYIQGRYGAIPFLGNFRIPTGR